jgi:TPP-dependent pyruvate/acetoin dehydrogenase alpha subunit
MAAGMALAEKKAGSQAVVLDFMGDGTLGEGIVYECLNIISLWDLPILIVLENNHIAQTTPVEQAVAGDIEQRFEAFGLPTSIIDSSDVLEILPLAQKLIQEVRSERVPRVLIIETARLGTHSKGDDTRSPREIEILWQERDPIAIQGARLSEKDRDRINLRVEERLRGALLSALEAGEAGA